jgi:hypothetical protein
LTERQPSEEAAARRGLLPRAAEGALGLLIALRHPRNTRRYFRRFGRLPNYSHPRSFSEKMQWRKLFDRNAAFPVFCDKLAARAFAQKVVPDLDATRLYWTGADPQAIPFDRLDPPYIVKPNNRSHAVILVRSRADVDEGAIIARCRGWLRSGPHGAPLGEWAYSVVPGRILVEEFLSEPGTTDPPAEYKVFVFDGRARFIYATSGRHSGGTRMRGIHAPDWSRLPWSRWRDSVEELPGGMAAPDDLARMVAAAERLACGIDHLRVDFYSLPGRLCLGEITVYDHSGHATWVHEGTQSGGKAPRDLDDEIGAAWTLPAIPLATRARRGLLG